MSSDYSSDAFIEFLEQLPELGLTNEATARNLKNSSLLLMADLKVGDMREISPEMLVRSYIENADPVPSESSKQAYKSRFRSALEKFIDYQTTGLVRHDLNEMFPNGTLDGFSGIEGTIKANDESSKSRKKTVTRKMAAKPKLSEEIKTFGLPIPLRNNLILKIENLPQDLTEDEAERISNIIKSFALPSLL
ncbi:hypothetical protein JHW33_08315 [Rahnella aceris]|uniref:hypothetical protein n=1 Tax=Rahnella sp. (strain Y9602) TaxID=2703885 RepID=UPI001903F219|nr:hypothetical protein [Rahnella aceris]QQN36600.1 hypothetical protein JHW33_08315 [Rahnella aceris]